jgi:hypothetical protein
MGDDADVPSVAWATGAPVVDSSDPARRSARTSLPMLNELHTTDLDGKRWPTYRPRRAVAARRLDGPTWLDGRFFRDGYLVRDERGLIAVVTVAAFEAVYELAAAYE